MDTPPILKSKKPRTNLRRMLSAEEMEQLRIRSVWANRTGHHPTLPTHHLPTVPHAPIKIDLRQGCTVKRALKGDDLKKACLVDIGTTTWFVKGGAGNDKDHEDASDLIRRLEMPGVAVPRTRALVGAERDTMAKLLDNGGPDAQQLADSLRADRPVGIQGTEVASSGRISELCGGLPLNKGFPTADEAAGIEDAIACCKRIQGLDQNAAWKEAFAELAKAKDDKQNTLAANKDRWGNAVDAKTRGEAIAWFRKNPPSGMTAAGQKRQRRIDILEHVDAGTVPQALLAWETQRQESEAIANQLKAFARSDAGIEAFAGLAAADLVCGMDDRVLSKFNGGNFHFDDATKTLICVDNHKDVNKSLDAPDQAQWTRFVSAQNFSTKTVRLEDALFARIYEQPNDSDTWVPGNYCQFTEPEKAAAKATFRAALADVADKVEADLAASPGARQRGKYLKVRLQIEDCLTLGPELQAPPTLPKEANPLVKTERKFKMVSHSEIASATKEIKKKLRDAAITPEKAREQLLKLQEQRDALKTDRRSEKIEFLIQAATLCQALRKKAQTLLSIVPDAPPGCWTKEHASLLTPMADVVNVWLLRAKKDAKMSAQLVEAWEALSTIVEKLS